MGRVVRGTAIANPLSAEKLVEPSTETLSIVIEHRALYRRETNAGVPRYK